AVVWRYQRVGSMFPRSDEQIAGGPRCAIPGPWYKKRRIRPRFDDAFKQPGLAKLENGGRKRTLQSSDGNGRRCCADKEHDAQNANEARKPLRGFSQIADIEVVHVDAARSEIFAGSTRVPGGLGVGSTQTRSPTMRVRNVEIFSVNGGGDAPVSGKYWKP